MACTTRLLSLQSGLHPAWLLNRNVKLKHPNPSVPRTKSLLSRFSSPLTKRNAKIFDFDIEPEHPHKTYKPGDKVKGQIVLSVLKGFDITHLVVTLHGYARVFKHQCTPGEVKDIPESLINGKGQHDFEYHGNGLASLFQDEQVLCGLGFLRKGVYKFGFELHFPNRSLPSSIEFERGDVNYLIAATVTRPTAISPVANRMYKVKFENVIDIESMYTPKSRAIYLEPMIRRGKVKRVRPASSIGTDDTTTGRTVSRQSTSTLQQTRSPLALQNPPLSPAPSQSTFDSSTSEGTRESTHSLPLVETESSTRQGSPNHSEPRSSTTSISAHTISAVTEIQRHGALPGESVSIRVKVEHTKATRGIIIATLYRQSRIDMHPPLPIATRSKKKKPEYEDVYPKSRTGLGGLYFTNGTPNMAFRKDLSQAFSMMIVNPTTKTADVRFSLKIPERAFPTMDNIPGGMISFTYCIEVVVDLTGKLGESRFLPSLTTTGPSFTQTGEGGNQLTSDWANSILDTAPLRRTKNVASFELPLIIGTEDSSKAKKALPSGNGPRNMRPTDHENDGTNHPNGYEQHYDAYDSGYDEYNQRYNEYEEGWYDENGQPLYEEWHDSRSQQDPRQQNRVYVPPPPEEEHLDEKSSLRRREELLFPSEPPTEAEGSLSATRRIIPSAPVLNGDALYSTHGPQQPMSIIASRASARSADTIVLDPPTPPPSLPDHDHVNPVEDKQELERQRLLAQASAPPTDDDDVAGPSTARHHGDQLPSAPPVGNDAEYLSHILGEGNNEALPQYRR